MSEDKGKFTRKIVHTCMRDSNGRQNEAFCLVERLRKNPKYPSTLKQKDGEGWNQVFDKMGIPTMMVIVKGKAIKMGGFA